MTNICAAIGLAQLEQIDMFLARKKEIAKIYQQRFQNSAVEFHQENSNVFHSYWMCSILVKDAKYRDSLREHLYQHGIETRPLFYPVHTMPMYSSKFQRHPVAEQLAGKGINLPSYPAMTNDEVNFVIDKILEYPFQ